jgi:hypothetical protein
MPDDDIPFNFDMVQNILIQICVNSLEYCRTYYIFDLTKYISGTKSTIAETMNNYILEYYNSNFFFFYIMQLQLKQLSPFHYTQEIFLIIGKEPHSECEINLPGVA